MRVKWDIDGKGVPPSTGGLGYTGPNLPKGSYVAKVKRMTIGAIKSQGENHGKPRISILLEVCGPERIGNPDPTKSLLGAPVWDGLNIIESGRSFVNGFLHALTDGSDAEKRAVEAAFWPPNGPYAKKEANRNGDEQLHVKKIGKYTIGSPNGELLVQITTKADSDLQDNYRPAVTQYLPYTGPKPESVDSDDEDEDDDDLIEDDEEEYDDEDDEDDEEYEDLDNPDDDIDADESGDEDDDDEPVNVGSRRQKEPPF
jgi:hypothetical protein